MKMVSGKIEVLANNFYFPQELPVLASDGRFSSAKIHDGLFTGENFSRENTEKLEAV